MSGTLNLKASAAAAVLACTALVSAGAGYGISRATMTARMTVTCPQPVASPPELLHALPNGPTINPTKGQDW